jgi:hypothetical protein
MTIILTDKKSSDYKIKTKRITPMSKEAEKRSSVRLPIRFDLMFTKRFMADGQGTLLQWPGEALDISPNGLGFLATVPLQKGEILRIHLPVQGSGILIPVLSEVRWARPEGVHYRVGLQFLS